MAGDFQSVLRSGEQIIWQGTPRQGVMLRPADAFLIPFSLLWGGFAIFWETSVLGITLLQPNPTTPFMSLFGVPFVVVGLYLIFGRFWADAWVRGGTRYALTNQRALVERTRFGYALNSTELNGKPIRLSGLRRDGRGTVEFGEQTPLWSPYGRAGFGMWASWLGNSAFDGIEEARSVFAKMQDVAGRIGG